MKKLISLIFISVISMNAYADTYVSVQKNGSTIILDTVKKCPDGRLYGEILSKKLDKKEKICWVYVKETKMVGIVYNGYEYKEIPESKFKNTKDQDDENQGD